MPRTTPEPRASRAARRPVVALHAEPLREQPWWGWAAFAVIAAYTVGALAMVFGPHTVGDMFTETDFYGSYGPGARLVQQGLLDPTRYGVQGPLFDVVLAAVGFVVRDLFVAAQLVSVAAMAGMLLVWRSLFNRWMGPLGALVGVSLLVANPWCWRFAWSATTDALSLGLQAASLVVLLGSRNDSGPTLRRTALAGLLAGLSFLTRYNFVVLVPAALATIALGWNAVPREARVRHLLAFALGFAAPVAPWMAWSAAHGGLQRGQLHMNVAYEVFAKAQGIPLDVFQRDLEPQFPNAWSVLARDPVAVVTHMIRNVFAHLVLDGRLVAGVPLALVAVLGAILAVRDRALAAARPALLVWALLFVSLVPAPHSERYSLAVLPAWAMLAGHALTAPRFAFVWRSAWLKLALVPLLLVAGLRETRAVTLRTLDQLPVEVLEAAERVRPLVRPGERVFARKPHFAWYAGLTPVALPLTEDLGEWGRLAQQEDVRWLYFSWPEAQLRNAFEWLLDSTSAAPGLTVRAATSHWPAVVYEIDTRFGDPPAWAGNDTLEAVHRARARAQLNPKDAETRVFLAMHEFSLGRHEVAQRWIDELLAIGPRDPDVLLLAAENRLQLRDPAGALSYYERADRVRPGTAEVRIGFGWVAAMQGDEVKAARFWAPVADASSDPVTLQRMMIAFARTQDATAYAVAQRKLAELGGAR